MKKNLFYTVSLALCIFSSPAWSYTLQEAVESALQNSVDLQKSDNDLKLAKVGVKKSWSGFLPSVTAQYQVTKFNYWDKEKDSRLQALSDGSVKSPSLNVRQNLFSSGADVATAIAAGEDLSAQKLANKAQKDSTILSAASAYQNVLTCRALYKARQQGETLYASMVKILEVKVKVGSETKNNLSLVKARLADSIYKKEQAFSQLQEAMVHFKNIVGTDTPTELVPINYDQIPIDGDLEMIKLQVSSNNLILKALGHQVKASKAKVKASYAKTGISADFAVSLADYNDSRNVLPPQNYPGTTYSLTLSMPILAQGLNVANIQEKTLMEKDARLKLDSKQREIDENLIKYWYGYKSGQLALQATRDKVNYQSSALNAMIYKFKLGVENIENLLTEQYHHQEAITDYIESKASVIMSALNLKFLTGTIDSLDLSKLNDPKGDDWLYEKMPIS